MSPTPKRPNDPPGGAPTQTGKKRLDTQIHRRKKAPPVPPLEAEWDESSSSRSTDLKMPPDRMNRGGSS